VAENTAKQPKSRMVRKVETIREKTAKGLDQPAKQRGPIGLALHYIAAPFKIVLRPVGKLLAKLGHLKPFRILGRILLPQYVRNSWKELRQVTWPGRKESWQLTLAVIIFAILFGAAIALVDYGLDKVFKQVLLK
jgi:preprotein translocase SecE subunit